MRRLLKIVGWILGVSLVLALATTGGARIIAGRRYNQQWTTHDVSFPIPFPLSAAELETLRAERVAAGASAADPLAGMDLQAAALARAIARGEHLVKTRRGLRWLSRRRPRREGAHRPGHGRVLGVAESHERRRRRHPRLLRHRLGSRRPSRRQAHRPVVLDAVHRVPQSVRPRAVGHRRLRPQPAAGGSRTMKPVGIGRCSHLSSRSERSALPAFAIDHQKPHPVEPPVEAASVELGGHIAQVCRGCHGGHLSGGKIAGDPNMPVVANLTPHETGLKGWTEADFFRALREGKRKDGTDILPQMPWKAYGQMKDVEIKALWAYLQTVPADGERAITRGRPRW